MEFQARTLLDIENERMQRSARGRHVFHSPFPESVLESITIEPNEDDIRTLLEIGSLVQTAALDYSLAGDIATNVLGTDTEINRRAELLEEIGNAEFPVSAENPDLFDF